MPDESRFEVQNAPPRDSRWLVTLLCCAAAAALLIGVRQLLLPYNIDSPEYPFDARVWRATTETSGPNARGDMVIDLQKRWLHVGMSADEVERLLGPPSQRVSEREWSYDVGPQIGGRLWMDPYTLDLRFDAGRRLGHLGLTQH